MTPLRRTVLHKAAAAALFASVLFGMLWSRTVRRREWAAMRGGVIGPGQALHREEAARPVTPLEGRDAVDTADLRRNLKPGGTYDVLLKSAITGPLARAGDSPSPPRRLVCVFEVRAIRTVEANAGGRYVETRRFGTFHMVKWTTGESEAKPELGRPGESILAPITARCSPGHSVEIPASLAADVLFRGDPRCGGASPGRAFLKAIPLAGKTIRLTRREGIGTESIEPIDCSFRRSETELLFDALAATRRGFGPEEKPAPGAASPAAIAQLGELLLPALRAALLQCEVLELEPGEAWDAEGLPPAAAERTLLTLYFTDATGYLLGHWAAGGELRIDRDEGVLKTARLTGELSFCQVRQQAFLFDETLADPAELMVCYSCYVR